MSEFLLAAAGFVLVMVAVGLVRILLGPTDADRIMAAQLLGTGGIAALLLLGWATGETAIVDVALTMALLAAFASFAFVKLVRNTSAFVNAACNASAGNAETPQDS